MYLNKATICGNLTDKPELKTTDSGTVLANFTVATNRRYTDADGNQQESAEFHDVVVFGAQAENCAQYLDKGQQVLVEGRIQTRSWEDSDGNSRSSTEIVAQNVQFGSRKSDGGGSDSADTEEVDYPEDEDITPEDIPF